MSARAHPRAAIRDSRHCRLVIDHDDHATLRTAADPACAVEIAGVDRSSSGQPISGVRHLVYDTPAGFRARLQVEFPRWSARPLTRGHRWHPAVEFGNWIASPSTASTE